MAEIYSNIINEMMDFFNSFISNNVNKVMKLLTVATIIISIPTLFSSIYGMNVKLPFQESPYVLGYVMITSLVLAIIVIGYFLRKK